MPVQMKHKTQIEMKFNDVSFIELSEPNTADTFNQLNDSNFINSSHIPLGESTTIDHSDTKLDKINVSHVEDESATLDNYNFKALKGNVSDKKDIKVISEKDGFKSPGLLNTEVIDLTKDIFDNHDYTASTSSKNLKQLTAKEIDSLKMEKARLEEIISVYTKNNEIMKVSK